MISKQWAMAVHACIAAREGKRLTILDPSGPTETPQLKECLERAERDRAALVEQNLLDRLRRHGEWIIANTWEK